jgi:hypothetical protein
MSEQAELPKAIAAGKAAATPDAVRPVRTAIGAGALAALYVLVIYLVQPPPLRLVAMFGGAHSAVQRKGGLEMVWLPPPGMPAETIEGGLQVGTHRAHVHRDHDAFVIEIPGVKRADIDETARRFNGEDGLEFHRVLEVEEMKRLPSLLGLPMKDQHPVDLEVDQWRAEDGPGGPVTDYYLLGDTRAAIDRALTDAHTKGWQLPAGTRIAYEHVTTPKRDAWRTYVIEADASLASDSIENAMKSYDPNTNRPIVLLDFTRAGGERFADVTARTVGHKLAMVIGDTVQSAPVINGVIRGGRASIAMGGGDPAQTERDADLLVSTLKVGSLPKGGQVMAARYVEPVDDVPMQWLARGTLALGAGALVALLVWMIVRITRPVRRRGPLKASGAFPWRRVFVTLTAPVALYAVTHIIALGIDADELFYQFGGTGMRSEYARLVSQLSFGTLGIMPVINAYIFVEVLALLVPGWRRRRHAGPDARAPLGMAVLFVATLLIVVQSWFITQYLYSLNNLGADVIGEGAMPRLLVIASFALGTLALVGVAALIRNHGLGNGYAVLLTSAIVVELVRELLDGPLTKGDVLVGAATYLAIGIPVATVLRWRIARLGEAAIRVPTSGVAPLGEVGGLVALCGLISQLHFADAGMKVYDWTLAVREHRSVVIALLAAMTLLWSFAFARPAVTRKLAERVGLVAPSRAVWWNATALSLALLLLVGAATTVTTLVRPSAGGLVIAIMIAMLAATVLDIVDDARARRVSLDRVWSVQQAQHADLVVRALDEVGIPCHLASANLRTLLAFFGPFAPIDVLVATEHVPAARTRLRELVE